MTLIQYSVERYMDTLKGWYVWDITYCYTDAIAMMYVLQNQGYQARLQQKEVVENE